MKGCKALFFAVLLASGVCATLALQAPGAGRGAMPREGKSMALPEALLELAQAYDCYFTLEEAYEEGEPHNIMEALRVKRPPDKLNVRQELDYICRATPGITYEVNSSEPRIIHIIDARLVGRGGYGLASTISDIKFEGTGKELLDTLKGQGIPVSWPVYMFTHQRVNYGTMVHVTGQDLSVRKAISSLVNFGGQAERILWVARTKLAPGELTYVYYH